MDNKIINSDLGALSEEFKAHCKVIKMGYEYPGYTGREKYVIITDLNDAQITERYASIVDSYRPFLILSKAAGEVIADFNRNEDKFFKRMQRDDCYGFEDGTTELHNAEIYTPDFTEELFAEKADSRIVWAAFIKLTPMQKKYVKLHLFNGKTFTQIAKDEGKAIKTVQESYTAAIKKLKKFLKTPSNLTSQFRVSEGVVPERDEKRLSKNEK